MKTKLLTTIITAGMVAAYLPSAAAEDTLPKTMIAGTGLEDAVLYMPQQVDSAIQWGCRDFTKDFQEATGKTLKITPTLSGKHRLLIIPAAVDKDPILEKLEKAGKLDLSRVRGRWESYLIQAVSGINDEVPSALIVAGSSPRAVA